MPQTNEPNNTSPYRKWLFIFVIVAISLGSGYLLLRGSRISQLISFYFYMSFSSTVIPLPTPPYVIALGKVFHPFTVAFIAALGSCTAALVEYPVVTWFFSKNALQQKLEANRLYQVFDYYFRRATFVWLLIAALTPIPLEPFRFSAILTRYHIPKYLLALFLGRFGCYYFMAWIGDAFVIPMSYIVILLIVLLVLPLIGVAMNGIPFADELKANKPKNLSSQKQTL